MLPERLQELIPFSSPLPPLVPSSSPLPPLVPPSSPSSPLATSSFALPERSRESALPERHRDSALPERQRDSALPERPRESGLPERPRESAPSSSPSSPLVPSSSPSSPLAPSSSPSSPLAPSASENLCFPSAPRQAIHPQFFFWGGYITLVCVAGSRTKATELPDRPWPPGKNRSWPPEAPDPPWPPKKPDPPWPPKAPDPPWPPRNPIRHGHRSPRPALEASPVSLPCISLQGAHPPSPVFLSWRGTRHPGGGGNVTYSSVCPPSQPIIIVITRPNLSSPEPQSSTPAPHLILITSRYLSTHLSSVNRRISLL